MKPNLPNISDGTETTTNATLLSTTSGSELKFNAENSTKSKDEARIAFGPKGEINACICFVLFASQLYCSYVSVFGRLISNPFLSNDSYNSTNSGIAISSFDYGTSVLSILLILVFGIIAGYGLQLIRLPGLLGMLLIGITLRNAPFTGTHMLIVKEWGTVLRKIAFIVILLRGGLSLDAIALRKLKGACIRLSLLPCTVEAIFVALAAKLVLGMDILFGFLLGFVLAAVSPAVVVPALLDAAHEGYGTKKGIPTLVIAAASIDDVYAITMFSLLMTIVFSSGSNIIITAVRAPVEVFAGVFFGGIIGMVLRYFPSQDLKNRHLIRLSLLLASASALLFGMTALGVDSIGAIAVLVSAFVAGHSWRAEGHLPEEDHLALFWHLCFQPLLFGIIGFDLSFDMLSLKSILLGLVVLIIGLIFRIGACSVAVLGAGLNVKERIFIGLAWLPKATVQAALAPVALEVARSGSYPPEYEQFATLIFAIAVLSILTTAPIGALLIRISAPRFLHHDKPKVVEQEMDVVDLE